MTTSVRDLDQAARCGEPSYVWRTGQKRRLEMIAAAAEGRLQGMVLDDGCGVGMYVRHMGEYGGRVFGIEFELPRAREASQHSVRIANAASENLPFPEATFDLVLSHEVLEHVANDHQAAVEIVRTLRPGGRLVLFVPNRGYPFETHGIYWRGRYHFGNIPLVNYLPRCLRDRLAPHVRSYNRRDLERLFAEQPVRIVQRTTIFGAYDNLIARYPKPARLLRTLLQALEHTPLRALGLSHFWIIEKI